jgi:hypothetical protein
MKVRLIDAQYIKDFSPINDNMDNKIIYVAIDLVMDKDLRQLIGSTFYDDLIAAVQTANGVIASLSAPYQALVDKEDFKNFLMWSVLSQGSLWMQYKYQTKSIAKKGGDGAETADNYSIDKLIDEAKNNSQYYGERLLYWLRDNSTTYTLLDDCGDLNSPKTAYSTQVFLGNKRPNGRINNRNTRYER